MAGKVIQGFFIGGRPRVSAAVAQPAAMPRPPGPPVPAFAGRPGTAQPQAIGRQPGPPAPAFPGRSPAAQAQGAGGSFQVDPARLGLVSGGGRPLPDAVRGRMEAALGADFSAVRVHVGPQAERIGAIAFTTGNDIYFAPGRFQPDTAQGQQLLGHELAHVVQQRAGRVRAPQWGGVTVVQDRLLEAEAERLGTRAALNPAPAPPKTATAPAHRSVPGSREIQGSRSGSKPEVLQRTIYKWNEKKRGWEVHQPGTAGAFKKPTDGSKGKYFNDVNGKSGDRVGKVRAGLTDLMMVTGSLDKLSKKRPTFWPDDLWRGLMALRFDLNHLGRITLTGAGNYTVQPYTSKTTPDNAGTILERLWKEVLQPFMRLNGQLNYIMRQDWFKKQEADVMIEVNFYKNRGYDTRLEFHKDTEGDNLFVNLLFNNQRKIPATEWIEDLAPSPAKLADMKKLMPDAMRKGIARSRRKIREGTYKLAEQGTVRGGIASKAAFVSWTDELVWHATPSVESRLASKILWSAVNGDVNQIHRVALSSALKTLHKIPGTQIGKDFDAWKRLNPTIDAEALHAAHERKKLAPTINEAAFRTDYIHQAFYADYIDQDLGGAIKKKIHKQDVERHFHTDLYRYEHHDPELGQETDAPLFGTKSTGSNDKQTGIKVGISRRNSVTKIVPAEVDIGPRSFLRTWVRVVRRNVAYATPVVGTEIASSSGTFKVRSASRT